MDAERMKDVEESAELFVKNLGPLFNMVSDGSDGHVMDRLSTSLGKALLLMALDRYDGDRGKVCRALGITKAKLEKELKRCGLPHGERKAA